MMHFYIIYILQGLEVQGISIMQTLHLEPIFYFFGGQTLNLKPMIILLEVRTLNLKPIIFLLNGQTLNLKPFTVEICEPGDLQPRTLRLENKWVIFHFLFFLHSQMNWQYSTVIMRNKFNA